MIKAEQKSFTRRGGETKGKERNATKVAARNDIDEQEGVATARALSVCAWTGTGGV